VGNIQMEGRACFGRPIVTEFDTSAALQVRFLFGDLVMTSSSLRRMIRRLWVNARE